MEETTLQVKQTFEHKHTKECWKGGRQACIEHRIQTTDADLAFWKGMAQRTVEAIRKVKGLTDRIESELVRALTKEK